MIVNGSKLNDQLLVVVEHFSPLSPPLFFRPLDPQNRLQGLIPPTLRTTDLNHSKILTKIL